MYAVPLCYVGFRDVPGVGPGSGSLKFVVEMKQDGSFVGGGGVVGFGSFGGSGVVHVGCYRSWALVERKEVDEEGNDK